MLFDNQRRHAVDLPATDPGGKPATIALLIDHLCQHLMKDPRTDMFVLDSHMCVSRAEFLTVVSSCLAPSRPARSCLFFSHQCLVLPASLYSLSNPNHAPAD